MSAVSKQANLSLTRGAIEMCGLTKAFGRQFALRGIDLDVAEGEFLTLFGPNGAGKTTLVRIVASLTRPTGGSVKIRGEDISKTSTSVRRHIGLISHDPLLYGDLTPDENLNFFARMYDLHTDDGISVAERIDTALTQVGLVARRRDPVRTFSRGMIQRLAIARAMLHEPDIMLLDEPYTGLDLQAADMLRAVLQELAASKGASSSASGAPTEYACRRTIILTTHNLEQGLEMCDRAAIINRGKVVWQAPRAGLDLESMKEIYRTVTRQKPTRQAPGANRRGASTG